MKHKIVVFLIALLVCVGFLCIFYPNMVYFLASQKQGRVIQDYQISIEEMNAQRMNVEYQKAAAYNEKLSNQSASNPFSEETEDITIDYLSSLNSDGIMGVIEIPKINVKLPIYHGTSEAVLQRGVGHLKSTSLPVGGTGTHAVLTGHRGYAGAKLFTNLDQLVIGDCFYLHVLDKILIYEIDQVLVVTPDQTEALKLEEGQDEVTLLTCTPYGINSHRLLIRGKRVEEQLVQTQPERIEEPPIPVKEMLLSFVTLIGISVGIWRLKKRKKRE
ncbi:MAG: class C sortase [Eubacterium sp.]